MQLEQILEEFHKRKWESMLPDSADDAHVRQGKRQALQRALDATSKLLLQALAAVDPTNTNTGATAAIGAANGQQHVTKRHSSSSFYTPPTQRIPALLRNNKDSNTGNNNRSKKAALSAQGLQITGEKELGKDSGERKTREATEGKKRNAQQLALPAPPQPTDPLPRFPPRQKTLAALDRSKGRGQRPSRLKSSGHPVHRPPLLLLGNGDNNEDNDLEDSRKDGDVEEDVVIATEEMEEEDDCVRHPPPPQSVATTTTKTKTAISDPIVVSPTQSPPLGNALMCIEETEAAHQPRKQLPLTALPPPQEEMIPMTETVLSTPAAILDVSEDNTNGSRQAVEMDMALAATTWDSDERVVRETPLLHKGAGGSARALNLTSNPNLNFKLKLDRSIRSSPPSVHKEDLYACVEDVGERKHMDALLTADLVPETADVDIGGDNDADNNNNNNNVVAIHEQERRIDKRDGEPGTTTTPTTTTTRTTKQGTAMKTTHTRMSTRSHMPPPPTTTTIKTGSGRTSSGPTSSLLRSHRRPRRPLIPSPSIPYPIIASLPTLRFLSSALPPPLSTTRLRHRAISRLNNATPTHTASATTATAPTGPTTTKKGKRTSGSRDSGATKERVLSYCPVADTEGDPSSVHLRLDLPILTSVSSSDGRYLAVVLGSHADWEPVEVVVLRCSGIVGNDTPGSDRNKDESIRVIASVPVHRSMHAMSLPVTPSTLLLLPSSSGDDEVVLMLSALYEVTGSTDPMGCPTMHAIVCRSSPTPITRPPLGIECDEPFFALVEVQQQHKGGVRKVMAAGDCLGSMGDGEEGKKGRERGGVAMIAFDPYWKSYVWDNAKMQLDSPEKRGEEEEQENSLYYDDACLFVPTNPSNSSSYSSDAIGVVLTSGRMEVWSSEGGSEGDGMRVCARTCRSTEYCIRAAVPFCSDTNNASFVVLAQYPADGDQGTTHVCIASTGGSTTKDTLQLSTPIHGLEGITALGHVWYRSQEHIVVGGGDGTVRMWNVSSGCVSVPLQVCTRGSAITSISISIASSNDDSMMVSVTSITGDCLVLCPQDLFSLTCTSRTLQL